MGFVGRTQAGKIYVQVVATYQFWCDVWNRCGFQLLCWADKGNKI